MVATAIFWSLCTLKWLTWRFKSIIDHRKWFSLHILIRIWSKTALETLSQFGNIMKLQILSFALVFLAMDKDIWLFLRRFGIYIKKWKEWHQLQLSSFIHLGFRNNWRPIGWKQSNPHLREMMGKYDVSILNVNLGI